MFVMLASSAYRALPYVIFYRDSHLREEVRHVYEVKHLRDSRMAYEWSIVVALYDQISYPRWYIDQSFEVEETVLEFEARVFVP
jgi:hypothetical protein